MLLETSHLDCCILLNYVNAIPTFSLHLENNETNNSVLSLNSQKHNNISRIFKYSRTQGVIFLGCHVQSQEIALMILAGPL